MKNIKTILLALLLVAASGIAWLTYTWTNETIPPDPQALIELNSDGFVVVTQDKWITFAPYGVKPTIGFIMYPGAHIDIRGYAPTLRAVAAEGYLVAAVPMPLNMPILAPNKASQVIAAHPEIEHWIIGGHSLGGVLAAQYADSHKDTIEGVVFWASYPAQKDDLSKSKLKVLSIYGTKDMGGVEPFEASKALLPADTTWYVIPGGNHSQFGNFGLQPGDNEASIPETFQWLLIVSQTADFLKTFNP